MNTQKKEPSIKEQSIIEDRLAESQRMGHIGSWDWDIANDKLFWSDETYKIFGPKPQSITPTLKLFNDYIQRNDRDYVNDTLRRSMSEKSPIKLEYRIIRPDGSIRYVAMQGTKISNLPGVNRLVGTLSDITEQKKRVKEKMDWNDTEVKMRKENTRLTDFFTNISHEFKTPLSLILIQAELMRLYLDDKTKMYELIEAVMQNSFRLTRLVGNLLDITKIDAGYMIANMGKKDIVTIIKNICDSVADYANARAIKLSFESNIGEKSMPVDSEKIERIMLNLLSNAIKHTERNGLIIVNLYDQDDRIVISIKDTGSGIPEDKIKIVFDRFLQVNTSLTRSSEGCGIGLALVKSLVEILGGKISVESQIGKGSTFYIELPVLEIDEQTSLYEIEGYDLRKKTAMELSDLGFEPLYSKSAD